ncbi:MAG: hypothetical protein U0905_10415 [Pirellulales bacterium]
MSKVEQFLQQLETLLSSTEEGRAAAVQPFTGAAQSFWELAAQHDRPTMSSNLGLNEQFGPSLRRTLHQLRAMETVSQCPILGVTGMLNAGKSSMVASFLSESGRKRILIGQGNDQGTHRFVLWVPQQWKSDPTLWATLLEQLRAVFDAMPEELSEDATLAFRQYNGELIHYDAKLDSLKVPLLATDSALDRWSVAILDCPDIQTGMDIPRSQLIETPSSVGSRVTRTESEVSQDRAAHRAHVLHRAMQLCSGFLLVVPANGIHDQTVGTLLESMKTSMPGIERILIVNRVPRKYATLEIQQEVESTFRQFELDRVYMAYHFEGPQGRERIPPPLDGQTMDALNPLPIAFRIDTNPVHQPPSPIPNPDYLILIGSQLDRGQLMQSCRAALLSRLEQELLDSWNQLSIEMQSRNQRLTECWRVIADSCLAFSTFQDRSSGTTSFRLHASREIVLQLSQSLERTAPWWAQPSRMVVRLAQSTRDYVSKAAERVMPLSWMSNKASEAVEFVQGRFRRGEVGKVVSANTLVDSLKSNDVRGQLGMNHPSIESRCQRTINRFQAESQTRLDESQLDAFTRTIWERMDWKQRLWQGVGPATLAFAPLLAVIALPFDFGGSSVLVLASIKELLFAGALGAGLALSNRDAMPKIAEEEAALQQWSDLFAVACDELGIPRPDRPEQIQVAMDAKPLSVRSSSIAQPKQSIESVFPLPLKLNQEFLREFHTIMKPMKVSMSS